jgi:hypothetical protein
MSNSNSFICCICGEECSDYNLTISEAKMTQCENDHVVCNNCTKNLIGAIDERKKMINYLKKLIVRSEKFEHRKKDIPQLKSLLEGLEIDEIDIIDNVNNSGFMDDYENSSLSYFCLVCQMKRVIDEDMIDYLVHKIGSTKIDILNEIQEKFKSFDEFMKYIHPKNKD